MFFKKKSYLGIDLGANNIKLVELQASGKQFKLLTYGYVEKTVSDIVRDSSEDTIEQTAKLLKKLCQQTKVKTRQAITGLPSFSVFSSTFNLPKTNKSELIDRIRAEARKVIPVPLEEVALDWKILNNKEKDAQTVTVFLNAAPKKLIYRYQDVFHRAGLELTSLETEGFALVRTLIGKDPGNILIVDSSATTTDLILVRQGISLSCQTINLGGKIITQQMSKIMGVDNKTAEQFKRDYSLANQPLPEIIKQLLRPIIDALKYIIKDNEQQDKPIEKIILSGGSAFLPNLDKYLSETLNIKVIIGDPWHRLTYPQALRPILNELAPRFAISVGLALRELEK